MKTAEFSVAKKVVPVRHHRTEIFLDQFGMVFDGIGERAEDDTGIGELFAKRRGDRHAVEYRIDRNARQCRSLVERDAELVVGFEQLGIDFFQALRSVIVVSLRRRIIRNTLIVDRFDVQFRPVRFAHRQPVSDRLSVASRA